MKRLLFMLSCLFIIQLSWSQDFSYTYEGQTLTYKVLDEETKTCEVGKQTEPISDTLLIPSIAKYGDTEYTVISIGTSAFYNNKNLKVIEIPSSITSIGHMAFNGCINLDTVYFNAENCEYCGEGSSTLGAFPSSLKKVIIGDNVKMIPKYAFYYCRELTSLEIPNSVITIGSHAFLGCSSLTMVSIGNSVTTIGGNAFEDCKNLTTLIMGNTVKTIEGFAFSGCSGLTSLTIPNSVTTIGVDAFSWCSGLTSLTLSNSVTTIGAEAFSWCSGLTSLTVPNSVTTIGGSAFSNCTSLKDLILEDGTNKLSLEYIEYSASDTIIPFKDCHIEKLHLGRDLSGSMSGIQDLKELSIGNSVTKITDNFYNCEKLLTIEIPKSVTSIEDYAFIGCTGLETLYFNAENCKLGRGVTNTVFPKTLKNIFIGSDVKSIPESAFAGNSYLTVIKNTQICYHNWGICF